MVNRSIYEEKKRKILIDNTAQAVHKQLKELDSNRKERHARWIWELLQNARDVSEVSPNSLTVEVKYNPGELVFLHNGRGFNMDEIIHLIFHGSTKDENPDALGQFGSGFLTTHLLSWEIQVSGLLDNKQWFDFPLVRIPDSPRALSESMNHAEKAFLTSLIFSRPESIPFPFTTRFAYPVRGKDAEKAVEAGIEMLKQCAPYVVVFNEEFASINIKTRNETRCFEVPERPPLDTSGIPQQITVTENWNENSSETEYLLTIGRKKTSVAVPLKSGSNSTECLPIEKTPRLFLGFPLVGTEGFSFPCVINSFNFTALEDRDGVFLGQSDNETNRTNQTIIEEAHDLLLKMLRFAGSEGWNHVHLLANVPPIQPQNGLNTDWLKEHIQPKFIEEIRQIPAVITPSGKLIESENSLIPVAEKDEGIEPLWDLLNDWLGDNEKLPRREEVIGWYKAIKSWAKVSKCEVADFHESIDGRKLASRVDNVSRDPSANPRTHRVSNLELKEGTSVINWLDRLIDFLQNNGLSEVIDKYRIVPSQAGFLRSLPLLHRDAGINDALKGIADSLGWSIRNELRDTGLSSLSEKVGQGDKEPASVTTELIKRLKNKALENPENPDDKFKNASTCLFAWIVHQKNYSALWGYPVFTADGKSVRYLPGSIQDGVPPLAPTQAWSVNFQQFVDQDFFDLFPPSRILNEAFFEKVPEPDAWQMLSDGGFIRRNIIITTNKAVNFKDIYPEEALPDGDNHVTADSISVTDIVERAGIMDRVSNSRSRALVFWRFLTEWLIKEDPQGLETTEAKCVCGSVHKYHPTEWLIPVRNNRWIRLGDSHPSVDASSLTKMLRDNEWTLDFLNENPSTVKLLEVIGVTEFDFLRAFVSKNDEELNVQDQIFKDILVGTGGDLDQISYLGQIVETAGGDISEVSELVQDLNEDTSLKQDLEKLRKRSRTIRENRSVGNRVEDIVGQILDEKFPDQKFDVKSVHEGADFEISEIEITQGDLKWWIEVKSTRIEGDSQEVKMSSSQGKKAVKEKDKFLLCVVPIPGNTKPNSNTVRENMRFIANIGERVAPLCENIDQFEIVRADITGESFSDVEVVVDGGKASILIKKAAWEEDGFRLEKLVEHLIPTNNDNIP